MNKEKICGFPVIRLPNSKSQEATASPLDKRSHQTDLLKKFMSAMSSESTKKSTLLVHKPAPKITLLGKPTIAVPDEACKQRSPDAKALTSPARVQLFKSVLPPSLKQPIPRSEAYSSVSGLARKRTREDDDNSPNVVTTKLNQCFHDSEDTLVSQNSIVQLTDEETRLCIKEGLKLPLTYPLSKHNERNLKRIRRKIRNKQSAQESRKRKQAYVESLERRLHVVTEELKKLENRNKESIHQMELLQNSNLQLREALENSYAINNTRAEQFKQVTMRNSYMTVMLLSIAFLMSQSNSPTKQEITAAFEEEEFAVPSSTLLDETSTDNQSSNIIEHLDGAGMESATSYSVQARASCLDTLYYESHCFSQFDGLSYGGVGEAEWEQFGYATEIETIDSIPFAVSPLYESNLNEPVDRTLSNLSYNPISKEDMFFNFSDAIWLMITGRV
ncbi:Cyclic AMP-responsive element-binding protein 3-like protein 3 [Trichinella nativa]|uniref:Cyclic AMP-responsive element-binding protein 3-like protein 3 n=1 Tax=Trichinella nativa TaxID=6335 RepID=A0A0V1KUS5_9BILA|nr:Cyclic AMP-responsive element-binding protein 3-like protein 3 [Trichinella nativa]